MSRSIKPSKCLFLGSAPGGNLRTPCLLRPAEPPKRGYALLVVMIMVTAMLISLTAALPGIYQEGQREREEEVIFRANQYIRACYLFQRRFGHYPVSVKDLLNTDGIRFLRRAYPDPLSRSGKWRFIHATATGLPIDSWTQQILSPTMIAGTSPESGSISESGSTSDQAKKPKHPPSECNSAPAQGSGGLSAQAQGSGFSAQSSGSQPVQAGTLLGAFIVGVAPCEDRQSIRVLNKQSHYDYWEFIALNYVQHGLPQSPQTQTPSGQSSTPSQPNPPSFLPPPNQPSSPPMTMPGPIQPSQNQGFGSPNQ